jgi:hypothetical protein
MALKYVFRHGKPLIPECDVIEALTDEETVIDAAFVLGITRHQLFALADYYNIRPKHYVDDAVRPGNCKAVDEPADKIFIRMERLMRGRSYSDHDVVETRTRPVLVRTQWIAQQTVAGNSSAWMA